MAPKEATRKSPRSKKGKADSDSPDGSVVSKSKKAPKKAPKKKAAPPVRKMAPPLPCGTILSGFTKKEWKLGKSIGKGGFGEIYEAFSTAAKSSGNYVIKVVSMLIINIFSTHKIANYWMQQCFLNIFKFIFFIKTGATRQWTIIHRIIILQTSSHFRLE